MDESIFLWSEIVPQKPKGEATSHATRSAGA